MELLEKSEAASERSDRGLVGMLSNDSRKRFGRFIRGYATAAARRFGGQTRLVVGGAGGSGTPPEGEGDELLISTTEDTAYFSQLIRDVEQEAMEVENRRGVKPAGDHYDYFATLPVDTEQRSNEEREFRLKALQKQNWRGRLPIVCGSPSGRRPLTGDSVGSRRVPSPHDPESIGGGGDEPGSGGGRGGDHSRPLRRRRSSIGANNTVGASAASATLRAEMRTREACESLRFLVFGHTAEVRAKEGVFDLKCGTREELVRLQEVWSEMDEDGSGDVEFQEFLSFFSRNKADRLLGMRCVNYLVGKAKDEGADDKEIGCTIQDMMRLMWLKATDEDLEKMMRWFHEAEFQRNRVATPPLLPKKKRRQIMENFPRLDWERNKTVAFQELIEHGYVDEATIKGLRDQMQRGKIGCLSEEDFLEMFCPKGYRAHEGVRTCVDRFGQPLAWISNEYFSGWISANKVPNLDEPIRSPCGSGTMDAEGSLSPQ